MAKKTNPHILESQVYPYRYLRKSSKKSLILKPKTSTSIKPKATISYSLLIAFIINYKPTQNSSNLNYSPLISLTAKTISIISSLTLTGYKITNIKINPSILLNLVPKHLTISLTNSSCSIKPNNRIKQLLIQEQSETSEFKNQSEKKTRENKSGTVISSIIQDSESLEYQY